MKKIAILMLTILLCVSYTGCVNVKDKNNNSEDRVSSVSGGKNTGASAQSGKTSSGSVSSANSSDHQELLSQLEDLENVLNSLDQVTESDIEVPNP